MTAAFHNGLKETGYVEGQNVGIVHRYADGQYDRLPVLAAEFLSDTLRPGPLRNRPLGDKCSQRGKPSQANRGPKNRGRSAPERRTVLIGRHPTC
jgi:hypothetical protein